MKHEGRHEHPHVHRHGVDDEHDDGAEMALVDNPLWQQDNVMLHSVGIDIGSSGTQVTFSRLHLRRLSEDLTSRYVVVRRDTHYESPVHLTPYADALNIDVAALGEMLDAAYGEARVPPEEVDTGVVILTGEALRRQNAASIAEVVSERAGDLVCATAGHHMEAMLAAYGSGAVRASRRQHSRLLNVDIGGGTTKLTLVDDGLIVATAAYHVGGRLIAVVDGAVVRLEPGGARHARRAGIEAEAGRPLSDGALDTIGNRMAEQLVAVLCGRSGSDDGHWLTDPLPNLGAVDGVIFSGGVAEYVYGTEDRAFGDLGPSIGSRIAAAAMAGELPGPLMPADARIRATVLGASEYTVQLSGISTHISCPQRTLPRRNLPVVSPHLELGEVIDAAGVTAAIEQHVRRFGRSPGDELALALRWTGPPEYSRLRALAEALVAALADRISAGSTLYLMLDGDVGRTLGRILTDELSVGVEAVVLDGVDLRDFDFVDLGRVRQPSGTVPVTIKSLVFSAMDSADASPMEQGAQPEEPRRNR